MGVWIALAGMALVTLCYDVAVRLACFFDPRNTLRNVGRLQISGLRSYLRIVAAYAGFRVRLEPPTAGPLPDSFLLVSNHQSLADIPVLAYAVADHQLGFVAKRELKWGVPAVSVGLRRGRHALIRRSGGFRQARRELVRLARLSAQGVCPVIFPEGTRSRTGRVGPFHSAAVRTILENAELPVLSAAVDGGHHIAGLKGLLRNLKGTRYRVRLLSVHAHSGTRTGIQTIIRRCHEEIAGQVEQWQNSDKTGK